MLPQLRELERRFPDTLAVIGVHSAKFQAEGIPSNLRQAVLRLDIRHPVVNDPGHQVWQRYAVSAWPTAVLIDPEGREVGRHSGEFLADEFAPAIQSVVDDFERQGKLDRMPLPLAMERDHEAERLLRFPGKVVADPTGNRLFIADTGHHRVLVAGLDGQVREAIGTGQPGLEDGPFGEATFHGPQGMAVQGDTLYVADADNHAIRRVDLGARRVERIAGTGEQARLARRQGPALTTLLNSPMDVGLRDGALAIANAGTHQLWELDLAAGELRRFAGTGREALYDDTLERSTFAQPSGLAVCDGRVYFADSESSAIRVADTSSGRVETLVGEGLFDFGDRDGDAATALLQHPLGVAVDGPWVYVADTYNNKVKRIDPARRHSETVAGTGEAGLRDGGPLQARFWEPGGLSVAQGRLYVADTNNHAIRVVDPATGGVGTVPVRW